MKKVLFGVLIIVCVVLLISCDNYVARHLGGTVTVEVEPGYKVTSATWKETDLFYFIEPMEEDYTPKTKKFVESSTYGVIEGEVVFKESRK